MGLNRISALMMLNISKDLNLRPIDEKIVYSIISYVYQIDSHETELRLLKQDGLTRYIRNKDIYVEKDQHIFDLPDLYDNSIKSYLNCNDMYRLASTNFTYLSTCFPFECSRKYVLNLILWSIVDRNLESIYNVKGENCNSNDIYGVLRTANHIRTRTPLPLIPSISAMLYSRYRNSLKPVLQLQALIFRAESIERVHFNVIKTGNIGCSFGLNCECGVVVLIILAQAEQNFFMGEFVFCRKHLDDLKCGMKLF